MSILSTNPLGDIENASECCVYWFRKLSLTLY